MNNDSVLVTGASSDIGLALIRRILSQPRPPKVLAHCNSGVDRVEELRASLKTGDGLVSLSGDFQQAGARELAAEILARFGPPRAVVHLPGLKLAYERFTKFNWEHFEADLRVQLQSAVVLLGRLLPGMAKYPDSRVVFLLSSVTRGVPPKFLSMYCVIKYAQLGLMRSLASEYGETGVCVNAVSPGMVDTRFLDDVPDLVKEASAAASPKRRNGTPADVVSAIEFLLSPGAGYLNGVEIPVTGGAVY